MKKKTENEKNLFNYEAGSEIVAEYKTLDCILEGYREEVISTLFNCKSFLKRWRWRRF